jgi:hypothetical protein
MRDIFGDNIVFHTSAEIINKGVGEKRGVKKSYNNILVIRDPELMEKIKLKKLNSN